MGSEGFGSLVILKPVKQLRWQGKRVSERLFMFVMRGSVNTSAPCTCVVSRRAKLIVLVKLEVTK